MPSFNDTESVQFDPGNSVEVRRVLVQVLFLNLLVAVAKLTAGWLSGTISMVADGFHSLTDTASNLVGLIGVRYAHRPPDATHPYGHRKFETLAAMAIGAILAMTAFEVLASCVRRLMSGGEPTVSRWTFLVMLGSLAVSVIVSNWESRRGKALSSEVLLADAEHTRSDVYTSLAVIASLIAAWLGYPQLDLIAALAITIVIGRAAFKILLTTGTVLTDTSHLPASQVREVAMGVAGVTSVHKIRSRQSPGGGYADLHVQVRPDLRLDRAHVIAHLVADRLQEELGLEDVLVHVEPPEGHRTTWRPGDS